MKLLTALATASIALTGIVAPAAQAGSREQAFTGGALYAATCAVMKGRINESQAGLVVAMALREEGISTSYATDPTAQQVARLLYVQKGGCR